MAGGTHVRRRTGSPVVSKQHSLIGKNTWVLSSLYAMPPMASAADVLHLATSALSTKVEGGPDMATLSSGSRFQYDRLSFRPVQVK
jgi:hypothetical protein